MPSNLRLLGTISAAGLAVVGAMTTPTSAAPPATRCKPPTRSSCPPGKVLLQPAMSSPNLDSGNVNNMVAADVDGDGKTDLLLSHSQGVVEVLLSKGDGTFKPGRPIDEKVAGDALAAADFDGDCKPDVLVAAFGPDSRGVHVGLHLNKGGGTFKPATYADIHRTGVLTISPADFNGDGLADVVLRGGGPPMLMLNSKASFSGTGTELPFKGPAGYGDIDRDGAADYATAERDGYSGPSKMCIGRNNGAGHFAAPACYPMTQGTTPKYVQVVDLDGDGKLDVAIANLEGSTFNVLLNKGDGTFGDAAQYKVVGDPKAFVVTDLDNDGKPELVIYKMYNSLMSATVLANRGGGVFADKGEDYAIGGLTSRADELLVSGDFLGNGLNGLAALDRNKSAVSVISATCKR